TDERDAVAHLAVDLLEGGHLLLTGVAPRGPEVQHHGLADVVREGHRGTALAHLVQLELRRTALPRSVDSHRRLRRAAAEDGRHHHGGHDRGEAGVAQPYPPPLELETVSVPCICVGCTSQRNAYVPGGGAPKTYVVFDEPV